jgi:hypothetical protein
MGSSEMIALAMGGHGAWPSQQQQHSKRVTTKKLNFFALAMRACAPYFLLHLHGSPDLSGAALSVKGRALALPHA